MKCKWAIVAAAVCALFLCGTAVAKQPEYGQVTAQDVNMRAQANKDADVMAVLPIGAEVEILGEEDGWYKVVYDEEAGYIRGDYVFINTLGTRVAYISEDGVNLRGGPSADSYIITKMAVGSGIKLRQMVGEWYFATYEGQSGFVHKNYLMLSKAVGSPANEQMLTYGMEGAEVLKMQKELARRGFLGSSSATGLYGAKTRKAVTEFQQEADLASADGIAGPVTLESIYDRSNGVKKSIASKADVRGRVQLLSWFDGGAEAFPKGAQAKIIDVRTGISFNIRRFGGWYHADSEPLTARDTANFKKIVGSWTWDRRSIWLVVGSRVYAASMNCMPHMVNPTQSNNFPGHFCVHFYKSKVHENSKECPRHQAKVQEAYERSKS